MTGEEGTSAAPGRFGLGLGWGWVSPCSLALCAGVGVVIGCVWSVW